MKVGAELLLVVLGIGARGSRHELQLGRNLVKYWDVIAFNCEGDQARGMESLLSPV